jgi:hypothetical protein
VLGYMRSHGRGLFDSANADEFTGGMKPGSAVVALAVENRWLTAVKASLAGVGADMTVVRRLPADQVRDVFGGEAWES